jgi:cytidylate kinase
MINIAIDGPSGAGKSTLAKAIAKSLQIHYLDTGAMYRGVGYAALQAGVDIRNADEVEKFLNTIEIETIYKEDEQQVLVNGNNVMPFIRTPEVSKAASDISAHPCVRLKLVAMQREVASKYDVVLDGRDIGTFVLPDAKYKFFVTADVEERARRRHEELIQGGIESDYQKVIDDMRLRDKNDSSRSLAPLKKADDAVLIDTTSLDINAVVALVLSKFRRE